MQQQSSLIAQLAPALIIWLACALPIYAIARRKGVRTGRILIGLFPLWMLIVAI